MSNHNRSTPLVAALGVLTTAAILAYSPNAAAGGSDTCYVIDPFDDVHEPIGVENFGQLRYCVEQTQATFIRFDLLAHGQPNAVELQDSITISRPMFLLGGQTQVFHGASISPGFDELFRVLGSNIEVVFQSLVFFGWGDPRAITVQGSGNTVRITGCEIVEFGLQAVNPQEGTVFVGNGNTLRVHATRFERNTMAEGGAIFAVGADVELAYGSRFVDNTADRGGALSMFSGALVVDDVTFTGNGQSAPPSGGSVVGGALLVTSASADVVNSRFEGNSGRFGGAISAGATDLSVGTSFFAGNYDSNPAATSSAGAVFVSNASGRLEITESTFEANATAGGGGAVSIQFAGSAAQPNTISDSQFIGNVAKRGGGAIVVDGAGGFTTYLEVHHSVFQDNAVEPPSPGAPLNHGGAIDAVSADVLVVNSAFDNNGGLGGTTGTIGGSISARGGALTLRHVTATSGVAQIGGNLHASGLASVALESSILAYPQSGLDCDFSAASLSDVTSIASDSSCGLAHSGSANATDPQLQQFGDYGFPLPGTPIAAPSSPAVDAADSGSCPREDLNHVSRDPANCDIGAVETF